MRKAILILLATACLLVALIFAAYWWLLSNRTGLWDYEQSVGPWRDSYTEFFPEKIPANASKVRYFHQPAVMQGSELIQLRLVLPEASIRLIKERASREALSKSKGVRQDDDSEELMPRLVRSSTRQADYEVFVLNTSRSEENWNHGVESGIAVSEKFNEVVYWLENW